MGIIKELSQDLIKKIAAGEVIERPASVVKELVENSIDAGATKIEIEIQRSGKHIKISDNGIGIDPEDVNLLFIRHATSKLNSFEDLWDINTLGFRGEALASISSISKVICRSKHKEQKIGFQAKCINGELVQQSDPIGMGTVFEIDDLFYNVPARQKFLKSETTEINHIYDLVLSLALSHSHISFTLKSNKNIILESQSTNNLADTISKLLGQDLQNNLIPISCKNNFLDLNGYISTLDVYRGDRKSMFLFINDRPIKCQIISKAIISAYEGMLPSVKFPIVVFNLKFKPTFVDINVHPTKKEVRYTHTNEVYNLVLHAIQKAISDFYKDRYKEKSVYSLSNVEDLEFSSQKLAISDQPYDVAPLWAGSTISTATTVNLQEQHMPKDVRNDVNQLETQSLILNSQFSILNSQSLFSVNHLKCNIIYSQEPIANMTKIGNKTIFEVGSIFDDNLQIVFSGEVVGDENYQKSFFNRLADLAKDVYMNYTSNVTVLQKKLLNVGLEDEVYNEPKRKKPQEKTLYKVWERDYWTCVYCHKQLLDPKTVKEAIPYAKEAFVTYVNNEGKEITNHILYEHMATYDHYLPVSKLPQFNFDIENLFASCIECNRKKSNSMELSDWKPNRKNAWTRPLELAGLCFQDARTIFQPDLKR